MEPVRILIALKNDTILLKLKQVFVESGHIVVDAAGEGNECLRKINALTPDLLVIEYNLPGINGYEVSKVVIEQKHCGVIMLASQGQEGLIVDLQQDNSFICLTKPINKQTLLYTVEAMIKNQRKIKELEKEISKLRNDLDTRKEVEKAKGLLMKQLGLNEQQAFKKIQKQSMDRGIPMKEIARAIILAYDI